MLKLLQSSWPVTRNAGIFIIHDLDALITQQITCQACMPSIYDISGGWVRAKTSDMRDIGGLA